jgi:phenylalanyl-tRNA synthetase beta chain
MLAHNLHRDVSEVRLFEMGTVFTGSTAQVNEATGLAIGITGAAITTSLHSAGDALFYEMKGAVEALLAKFSGAVTFDAQDLPAWIEAGRGARALLDGAPVAWFGELSSAEAQRRKLRQTCVLAEVRAAALLARPLRQSVVRELSRFQAVARDFSFIFPDTVRWDAIAATLAGLGVAEMQRVSPVEVFRDAKGKAVAAGHYSVLVRAVFQSNERTLTDEEISGWYDGIVVALKNLGGVRRE